MYASSQRTLGYAALYTVVPVAVADVSLVDDVEVGRACAARVLEVCEVDVSYRVVQAVDVRMVQSAHVDVLVFNSLVDVELLM
eukprot:3927705-Amphidinium_carterae.1